MKINILGNLYGQHTRWGVFDANGLCPTLTSAMGCGGHTPMVIADESSAVRRAEHDN